MLIARGLAGRGLSCGIYVLSPVREAGRYEALLASCRAAGVVVYAPASNWGGASVVSRLAWTALTGRRRIVLWTWGYRAEALRLAIPMLGLARGIFSIRSASESQLWRWRWLLRFGRAFTWRYVSNSQLGIELADKVAPGIALKAQVVLNAMEPEFFSAMNPTTCRPTILRVAMLGNARFLIKGYDLALDVAQAIGVAGFPIRIHIGGAQPPGEPILTEQIKRRGLEEMVIWEGPVSDPAEFLRAGHVFMLLSRYEGMPNALFEAMALGLPCIATAVGDLPRLAEESCGLRVVPIEDSAAAFSELRYLWENWDTACRMGARAREFCRSRLSEATMLRSVAQVLELAHDAANGPPET